MESEVFDTLCGLVDVYMNSLAMKDSKFNNTTIN